VSRGLLIVPLADRIKALREAAGLSQMALAVRAGIALSALTKIEQGAAQHPRYDTIRAIARALGITEFAAFDDPPEESDSST
jgi:transcriptional regulator with XRE-family HTH domain